MQKVKKFIWTARRRARNRRQKALTLLRHPQPSIERPWLNTSATDSCVVTFWDFLGGRGYGWDERLPVDQFCPSFVLTSVWKQHSGCPRLFSRAQKVLIGNHSVLLTDTSITPAPAITTEWGPVIHEQLFTISPLPEQTHRRKHTLMSMRGNKHACRLWGMWGRTAAAEVTGTKEQQDISEGYAEQIIFH